MTYCHISAQIDRHLAEWDRAQAWQEAIEERASFIRNVGESWDEAKRRAKEQLIEERRRAREDFLASLQD